MNLDFWSGREDNDSDGFDLRWHQVVKIGEKVQPKDVVLVEYSSDTGVIRNEGRPGAKDGPRAIRRALANLAAWPELSLVDDGERQENGSLEAYSEGYSRRVAEILACEGLVIGMGGGHDIAWGSYRGLRLAYPEARIGILNFDAHFDMRRANEMNSGTSFLRALEDSPELTKYAVFGISRANNTQVLFDRAEKWQVKVTLDEEMVRDRLELLKAEISDWCAGFDVVCMTVCLDVFSAAVCPGVSAPAARGVSLEVIEPLVVEAMKSGKVRVFDVAECNPKLDLDGRTARVAGRLIWQVARTGSALCR